MKSIFTKSEADPNHCLKVVDDRPLILEPCNDDLFLKGAYPLICKSKRELDFRFGIVNCKLVTTSMELNFKKLCGSDVRLDLGNAFEFHKLIRIDVLGELSLGCFVDSMKSSYMVEPHWIGGKNLPRYLQSTISHGLRYTAGNVKLHEYLNADWAGSVEDHKSASWCWFSLGYARYLG